MEQEETPVMCLEKVKNILGENGEHWTKKSFARDDLGLSISPSSSQAVKFCLLGAIEAAKCEDDVRFKVEISLGKALDGIIGNSFSTIVSFNDDPNTEFEQVKKIIEKTINRLKGLADVQD